MTEVVVLSAVRTPIAVPETGALSRLSLIETASIAVAPALERSGLQVQDVDDIILGEAHQGGGCLARYLALQLALPSDTPGLAINRWCASGMTAIQLGAAMIGAGTNRAIIAGGIENRSQLPRILKRGSGGSPSRPWLPPTHPPSPEAPAENMAVTIGENSARACGISREAQDLWSLGSHQKAVAAHDSDRFRAEIASVEVEDEAGNKILFDSDERPRRDTTLEQLAALRSVTGARGTITAGNSSGVHDAASALVLADAGLAARSGLEPLASIRGWATVGIEPRHTGLAPILAIPRALEHAGLELGDIDLFEINEPFASSTLAIMQELKLDPEQVNVHGGAIALGHPVCAAGARILTTLIHALRERGGGRGVAALCAGGGMGSATVVEVHAASSRAA